MRIIDIFIEGENGKEIISITTQDNWVFDNVAVYDNVIYYVVCVIAGGGAGYRLATFEHAGEAEYFARIIDSMFNWCEIIPETKNAETEQLKDFLIVARDYLGANIELYPHPHESDGF